MEPHNLFMDGREKQSRRRHVPSPAFLHGECLSALLRPVLLIPALLLHAALLLQHAMTAAARGGPLARADDDHRDQEQGDQYDQGEQNVDQEAGAALRG